MKKLLSGNKAFALDGCHAVAKVTRDPFMAACDRDREEVSSANIG